MLEAVPNPDWVARPGSFARSHEAGRSVDVTIASPHEQCPPARRVGGVCLVDMGTDFDDFSPRALAFATEGISTQAQANRADLRAAQAGGRAGQRIASLPRWSGGRPVNQRGHDLAQPLRSDSTREPSRGRATAQPCALARSTGASLPRLRSCTLQSKTAKAGRHADRGLPGESRTSHSHGRSNFTFYLHF